MTCTTLLTVDQQRSSNLCLPCNYDLCADYVPAGYPLESHTVWTPDGWALGNFRIPHGKQRNNQPGKRPVVLLLHGFSLSSLSFVLFNPNESIAYILADAGECMPTWEHTTTTSVSPNSQQVKSTGLSQ